MSTVKRNAGPAQQDSASSESSRSASASMTKAGHKKTRRTYGTSEQDRHYTHPSTLIENLLHANQPTKPSGRPSCSTSTRQEGSPISHLSRVKISNSCYCRPAMVVSTQPTLSGIRRE